MNKILLSYLLILSVILADEIPIEKTTQRAFGKNVVLNSKIIQLSNAKQSIMSLVSGHIEHYYVKLGQKVQRGDKIAQIESILLSKMTAEYISLKKQFISLEKNYKAVHSLYKKGMASIQSINSQKMRKNEMLAKISALSSQLETLGINTKTLKKASANYILYAHSSGTVSQILQPLHGVVNENTPIVSIIKPKEFYIKSYLLLKYDSLVKIGQKLTIHYQNREIVTYIEQILPQLDEETQQIVLLSSLSQTDESQNRFYINTYLTSTLYFNKDKSYIAIKKFALSFFKNEWVVFVPKEEEHHEEGEEHKEDEKEEAGHHDGDHEEHEEGEEEHHEGEGHGGHGEHEENEVPYEVKVIEIITSDDEYVAIKGLDEDEEYVSDKSYYVKSLLLKSSLGGHGH